jgi:superfamily II DNA/RNA helicase
LEDVGYATPTPIQAQAIPYVLMGRDVLGCAQTGTGKTASFTLPMIDILGTGRARARMPRSLIIEPTRELAAQVAESFERYGKYGKLTKALLIGGESFVDQERLLDRGVDVLIATPGRLIDLFERGKILLADVRVLVIDESDRMLDMGFIPDVERIVGLLPKIRQTLFFSATMPREIRRLADAFLMNPKEISVSPPASPAESVVQRILRCDSLPKLKRAALRDLIHREDVQSGLIFCNRKRDVGILFRSLKRHGFSVAELHGDMAQPARTATLETFRAGQVKLLVCSDVAARGLDIPQCSHVFNFDVSVNSEDYIHRIGRTGRAGRPGQAFTLVTPADRKGLAAIVRMLGREIDEIRLDRQSAAPAPAPTTTTDTTVQEPREEARPRRARSRRKSEAPAPRARPSEDRPAEDRRDSDRGPGATPAGADAAPVGHPVRRSRAGLHVAPGQALGQRLRSAGRRRRSGFGGLGKSAIMDGERAASRGGRHADHLHHDQVRSRPGL